MKQAKTFKRFLSILLSLVVLVSTTVFAATVEKLQYKDSYADSEITQTEVNGGSNLLLGNAYRKTGNIRLALNNYLSAMELNPDSPAVIAHNQLIAILNFYNKDMYNQ